MTPPDLAPVWTLCVHGYQLVGPVEWMFRGWGWNRLKSTIIF